MKTIRTCEIPADRRDQNGQFKQDFIVFTDTDQMFEEGERDGMYENLQIKLGKTYLELHKIIAAL